jgi:hypothetical protein
LVNIQSKNKEENNMTMKRIWEKARKEKEKKDRADAVKDFAVKAVDKVEEIKDAVSKNTEAAKDTIVHAAQDVSEAAKDSYKRAGKVNKDIKAGFDKVAKDIHQTAQNISDKVKK